METPDFIDALTRDVRPVRRVFPPLVRAGLWVLLALVVLALLALAHGVRPNLGERLARPDFLVSVLASAATGVLGAAGCFHASLPDRSRLWLLLPLPAAGIWVSTIGYGCLTDWVSVGPDGMHMGEAISCFVTLLAVSVPLSVAMFVMLRHIAALRPAAVTLTAGLAVAGIVSTALSLFHPLDASIMILIWNLGVAAIVIALEGVLGGRLLRRLSERRDAIVFRGTGGVR